MQAISFQAGPGRARTEISISLSSRAGLEPKFQFLFRGGSCPVWKKRSVQTSNERKNYRLLEKLFTSSLLCKYSVSFHLN